MQNELNQAAFKKASKGELVQLMKLIDEGANDFTFIAMGAIDGGYEALFDLLTGELFTKYQRLAPNLMKLLSRGAKYKDISINPPADIVDELKNVSGYYAEAAVKLQSIYKRIDYEEAAEMAAYTGHDEILNKIMNRITDFNQVAYCAALKGYEHIVKNLMNLVNQQLDFNYIAKGAARGGYSELLNFLIENGANNFSELIVISEDEGYLSIAKDLRNKRSMLFRANPSGSSSGSTNKSQSNFNLVPKEVYHEYLGSFLTQREMNQITSIAARAKAKSPEKYERISNMIEGIEESQIRQFSSYPLMRLLFYLYFHPNSKAARQALYMWKKLDKENGTNNLYTAMMEIDDVHIIKVFPDKIKQILKDAMDKEKLSIIAKIIALYPDLRREMIGL